MTEQFANFAQSSLARACGTNDTTIYVANASTFPALGNFRIVVQTFDASGQNPISNPEIMIVTAVGGNGAFTVTRGAESTTPIAFRSGAKVVHIVTAAVMTALEAGGGGSALTLTDGSNTVANVAKITVTGGTVGGTTPNATLTITGGGSGTVTSVSVATANGFAGTVANPTTTPAITIKTSVTGLLKGNGTSVSAAVGDTDFQNPITLTTTGSSGAATFLGDTLNIPQYSGGGGTPGGSNTQVQYNNSSAFGGISGATSDGTNLSVTTQSTTDNSTKAASTAYVTTAINNAIAGVNPATAVQAATTSSANTSGFTYNNGASGIGATFTGSTNTAITIDGFTFTTLGQRLLVKNDTQSANPGAYNGIYYVTQVQTAILPPILTRALDYNQPSDINNTGAIPVINGTVNALTSWLLTSSVTTVGTSVLTYTQFSFSTAVTSISGDGTYITNSGSTGAVTLTTTFGTAAQKNTGTSGGTVPLLNGANTWSATQAFAAITATTINGNTFTTGTYTLTGTAGKTLTFDNSLELAGTDSTTMTFPTTSATVARTDSAQTFTGIQTFSSAPTVTPFNTAGFVTNNSSGVLATGTFTFSYTFNQPISANQTITLANYFPFACTVTEVYQIQSNSGGTCTANFTISGTSITSLSAISVTNTAQNVAATGANTISAGANPLALVITSASSLTSLIFTLAFTRTS